MRQRFLIILTAIIPVAPTSGCSRYAYCRRKTIGREYSRTAVFRNQVWQNAAIRFDQRPFSLTSVSVKGLYEQRGDAALAQEGNRRKDFSAEVNSFVVLNPRNRLFGQASYRNGRRENVVWNENSDYSLLYPYVVGDSIGGFMKEEEYKFSRRICLPLRRMDCRCRNWVIAQ